MNENEIKEKYDKELDLIYEKYVTNAHFSGLDAPIEWQNAFKAERDAALERFKKSMSGL